MAHYNCIILITKLHKNYVILEKKIIIYVMNLSLLINIYNGMQVMRPDCNILLYTFCVTEADQYSSAARCFLYFYILGLDHYSM